jgi:quercetin dioxygenase-like cupin family protein
MPVYEIARLTQELVTPKHSTARGGLVTGEQIELGVLRYKAGEGAREHAHPHEQIVVILKGRTRFTLDGVVHEVGPGSIIHVPPNVPHASETLEDSEVISAKGMVGGVGHRI